jgi:hypothetical protein
MIRFMMIASSFFTHPCLVLVERQSINDDTINHSP